MGRTSLLSCELEVGVVKVEIPSELLQRRRFGEVPVLARLLIGEKPRAGIDDTEGLNASARYFTGSPSGLDLNRVRNRIGLRKGAAQRLFVLHRVEDRALARWLFSAGARLHQ